MNTIIGKKKEKRGNIKCIDFARDRKSERIHCESATPKRMKSGESERRMYRERERSIVEKKPR